jgi:hypothetical protein
LAELLPAQVHLLLATRSDPPLPLSRLRGRGQMLEVRTDQSRWYNRWHDILLSWDDVSRPGRYTFSRKAKHTAGPVAQPKPGANRDLCVFHPEEGRKNMISPIILTVYLVGIGIVFLLQVLVYVRNGEKVDRVRTLWLTPIVVLPIALYFYLFAGIAITGWVLIAGGVSLVVGAVLEWIHIRSAQITLDGQQRTLRLERSSRLVLVVLMLLDAVCYMTLLMLILNLLHVLHTSFFRQFAPELVMYSLGSRGVHALYLFLFWKQAQRRNDRVYATRQWMTEKEKLN